MRELKANGKHEMNMRHITKGRVLEQRVIKPG